MNLVEIINELNFNVLFPLFIGFKFLLETYLKQRNIQSMEDNKEAIPERFVGVVTEEEYKKSINYNTERIRFSMLTALISVGVLLLFTTGGLLNSLTKVVQGVTQSNVVGIILLGLFIVLIDEIHTPDSSRYWVAETYQERMSSGLEPQNIDKEFLRLWFVDNCDPYNDDTLPDAPKDLVTELSSRYIYLYETITGGLFPFPDTGRSIQDRINENMENLK